MKKIKEDLVLNDKLNSDSEFKNFYNADSKELKDSKISI